MFNIFLVLAVILSVSAFISYRVLERKFRQLLEIKNAINLAVLGGYYYYYRGKEKISDNLTTLLKLEKNNIEFTKIFYENGQSLLDAIEQIKKGYRTRFRIMCTANIDGENKIFQCVGNRIEDAQGAYGVIVWFYNVSNYLMKVQNLQAQNEGLKSKLMEYLDILDSVNIPIFRRNTENKIDYCNLAYSKLIDEDTHLEGYFIPELSITSERTFGGKTRNHILANGKNTYIHVAENDANNSNKVSVVYDVTDLENKEEDLERHVLAHAKLIESASSPMAIFGKDMRLKFYNTPYMKLWNFEESWLNNYPSYGEVLENLRIRRLLPEQADFASFRKKQIGMFSALDKPHEEFFYLPDGRAIKILVVSNVLGGLLFSYEDITERLVMERSYNTLIAVQRETIDNLNEGIAFITSAGSIKLYNSAFAKLWPMVEDLPQNDIYISNFINGTKSVFRSEDEWGLFKQDIFTCMSDRIRLHKKIERNDGKVLEEIIVPLPDGAILLSCLDITDSAIVERALLETNKALEEVGRMKTDFLANISYELRTPLTSIKGFSELLKEEYFGELNTQQHEYVEDIMDSSRQLMLLIDDIIDLSSIEAGNLSLDISIFELHSLISSAADTLRSKNKRDNITIRTKCGKNLGQIKGDKRRLEQIIFNIANNFVRSAHKKGCITIEASIAENNQIIILIKDNRKAQNNSVNKLSSDIAYSVAEKIITMHDGIMEIGTTKNGGSCVTFYLTRVTHNEH